MHVFALQFMRLRAERLHHTSRLVPAIKEI